ncbi:hypothetical protein ABK040_005841 [Willaertia magna]
MATSAANNNSSNNAKTTINNTQPFCFVVNNNNNESISNVLDDFDWDHLEDEWQIDQYGSNLKKIEKPKKTQTREMIKEIECLIERLTQMKRELEKELE